MGQTQSTQNPSKLYQRGTETINLDVLNNDAATALQYRLSTSKLNDKQKKEVSDAYNALLQGINNGTVTYKPEGGFDNSIGLTNSTDNDFDAAGIAAGILGTLLRNQEVYQAPATKKSESGWKGSSSIKKEIANYIFGDNNGNIEDFINLDYDPQTKKIQGNSKRSKKLQDALNHVISNFDQLFPALDNDIKSPYISNLQNAIVALNEGLTPNEYLEISKITGISNLQDLFGDVNLQQNITAQSDALAYDNDFNTAYNTYIRTYHPRINSPLKSRPTRVDTTTKYSSEDMARLQKALRGLSKENLFKLIFKGLQSNPIGKDLNNVAQIIHTFRGIPSFNNEVIVATALELGRNNNYFYQFSPSSNNYFIPFQHNTLDSRNVGLIYQINPNGKHKITEMEKNDIPFFQEKWKQDFLKAISSNKQGGVLIQKFNTGNKVNTTYNPNTYSWDAIIYNNPAFKDVLTTINNTNYLTINELQNKFKTSKIGGNQDSPNIDYNQDVFDYQKKFNDLLGILNTRAIEQAIQNGIINRKGNTGDNASGNYADGYSGAITNLRHLGTSDHSDYLSDMNQILNANGMEAYINDDTQMINFRPMAENASQETDQSSKTEDSKPTDQDSKTEGSKIPGNVSEKEDVQVKDSESESKSLLETLLPLSISTPKSNLWEELIPEGLNATRFVSSLISNKRIEDTILPSLKPVLQNTYERYSPVTDNFGLVQHTNKQAANTLSTISKPFTSNAALASARLLDGLRQAQQAKTQAYLANDQEIKQSQAQALARQEDKMARRSDIDNKNRKASNLNNKTIASLKASRIKQDFNSINEFLGDLQSKWASKLQESRERSNQFAENLISSQTQDWLSQVIEPAEAARSTWERSPGNELKDISEWGEYQNYVKFKREANKIASDIINSALAKRYGWNYKSQYNSDNLKLFNWNNRRSIL